MKRKTIALLAFLTLAASAGIFTTAYSYDGKVLGRIYDVNRRTGEIQVRDPEAAKNIRMGDKLYVRIDNEMVIMKSTEPMMTISKCRLCSRRRRA